MAAAFAWSEPERCGVLLGGILPIFHVSSRLPSSCHHAAANDPEPASRDSFNSREWGRCRTPASRLSDSAATEGSARLGLGEASYPGLTQLTAPKLAVMFPTVMETSNGIITTTSSGGLASVPFGPCVISHQQFHSSQKCRQSVGVGKRVSWWVWGRASHPDRQVDEECSAHGGARRRTEAHAPP